MGLTAAIADVIDVLRGRPAVAMTPTTGSAWSPSSPRTTACPNSEVERIEKAIEEEDR
jgi:hypothetical protein